MLCIFFDEPVVPRNPHKHVCSNVQRSINMRRDWSVGHRDFNVKLKASQQMYCVCLCVSVFV